MKIESDATEITDGITATIVWPENAIALAKIASWNIDAANFIANLNTFDNLKISFRYGTDSWTEYFDGIIEDVNPILTLTDQTVVCTAYGHGRCYRNTHCDTSYGKESLNPTIDTPGEIWSDLLDNYVEKSFHGNFTGYDLAIAYNNGTLPTINYIFNPYRPNIDILNQTLLLIQAYRAGLSGHHWIVSGGTMRIKRIGTDLAGWPSWWNTDQAGSTLVEGTHFISYSFSKRVRSKDFANKILLSTDLRKPGYDYWTNKAGNQTDFWGWTPTKIVLLGQSGVKIVGANSLRIENPEGVDGYCWYPSGQSAGWDVTKWGSEKTIPTIGFYARRSGAITTLMVMLGTDTSNTFSWVFEGDLTAADKFYHFSFPIGPYYSREAEKTDFKWTTTGSPNWATVNAIYFHLIAEAGVYVYIDDLHLTGKIIREAYNSTNITANCEHQKLIRMNSAVDDSMKAADDSGTAARLAYAELLRAQTVPIVGTVKVYGMVDILPGQFVHIHAEKTNGTFRIDDDFRVKEVQQEFFGYHEFYTTLQLTDDLVNTFAKGPADLVSEYNQVVFCDPEAQSLKATGIDPLILRLSKDYPT